jgi:cobalt-zinc-cadmium efflux system membrane fusion protein
MRICSVLILSLVLLIIILITQNDTTESFIESISNASQGKEHEEHEEHEEGEEHEENELKLLSYAERQELGIKISKARSGILRNYIELTGEIALNEENLVHLVPRVEGIVLKVKKKLGNRVKKGEVMAVLESREVADAKAEYLASLEQLALAKDNYNRNKKLQQRKLIPEQKLFEIKQILLEIKINNQNTARKLNALGFSDTYVKKLPKQSSSNLTKYQMVAPIDGIIIEKHITLGEILSPDVSEFAIAEGTVLNNESSAYVIADLRTVWVNFDVYPSDLLQIKKNQIVMISSNDGIAKTKAGISYISPTIDKETRTALIRSVLPNPKGQWRAGLFVTGKIQVKTRRAKIVVPKTALQNNNTIFVVTQDGYVLQSVKIGKSDELQVEILSGLKRGQHYVSKGGFILKAELQKSLFAEAGHSH